jgi:Xaa-Pro aminopeptidase
MRARTLPPRTPLAALRDRRASLAERLGGPALVASGSARARNYRANRYPFRATSPFLYLVGAPLESSYLLLDEGRAVLFTAPPDADDALWHGPRPSLDELALSLGLDEARDVATLAEAIAPLGSALATLPTEDHASTAHLAALLGRPLAPSGGDRLEPGSRDEALADALLSLRLRHDEAALAQLRYAASASARAHVVGMRATRGATTEAEVRGAMVGSLIADRLEPAYGPIVTVHGEVLHHDASDGALAEGQLLLADVGGETPEGWAADITRTWPTSGRFSPSQRAVYEVVLRAQLAAIEAVRPGASYRSIHQLAARVLTEGLVALGLFRGSVDGLLERNAPALFFPHGVGHLLGLDVHDMEDLGDRAGYAAGRARSSRFGERYLRLDRELEPGMVVTIEPGFYRVPALLAEPERVGPLLATDLDRDVLATLADVRGIRIEDDVLCTASGHEVLTRDVPKAASEIEQLMGAP